MTIDPAAQDARELRLCRVRAQPIVKEVAALLKAKGLDVSGVTFDQQVAAGILELVIERFFPAVPK